MEAGVGGFVGVGEGGDDFVTGALAEVEEGAVLVADAPFFSVAAGGSGEVTDGLHGGSLPDVEDAFAVGALGEGCGVECFAADAFGDGDAATGAAGASDAGDGLAAAPADVFVESEVVGWDGGGERLTAGVGFCEAGGVVVATVLELLELLGACGTRLGEVGFGLVAGGGCFFELLHDLEELVFELAALGTEQFEFVLDSGEFFGAAYGAVVEASFFRLDAGVEVGDGCFEVALAALELSIAGVGGGVGFFGGLEDGGVGEARVEVGQGGLEGGGLVVDFLEGANVGDERHGGVRG